jgi:hypothetical protein
MDIKDLDLNLNDNSAKLFTEELLTQLQLYYDNFDTHAMSPDYQNYLEAKKLSIKEIIDYIKRVKPTI